MGWLDLLPRRTNVDRYQTVNTLYNRKGGDASFASQTIDLATKPKSRAVARPSGDQEKAWAAFEEVGEVGYVVDFFASAAERVQLFPSVIQGGAIVPIEESDTKLPQGLIDSAHEELARIRGPQGTQASVLSQMAVMYKVPGEGWLVARDQGDGTETWQVYARGAVEVQDGRWVTKETPGDRGEPFNPESSFLGRFWRSNPRWHNVPFSELMRVLPEVETLQLIERSLKSASVSRLAGAGLLLFDSAAQLGVRDPKELDDEDFLDEFVTHAQAPILTPGSVAGFVPYTTDIVVPDGKTVEQMVHHVTFERPITQLEIDRAGALRKQITFGLGAPPEIVTGFGEMNHWNGALLLDQTYQGFVEPLIKRIAETLIFQVVQPGLLARGFDVDLVKLVTAGVNTDDLITRPDPTKDALDAFDRNAISAEALRRRLEFSEADAPSVEELGWRLNRKVEPAKTDDDGSRPVTITAAAVSQNVGEQLADLDQVLLARVHGAADAAIRRVLEKALNRVRNRVRRTDYAVMLEGVDPTRLGAQRAVLTELAIDTGELVDLADIGQLETQFDDWTTQTLLAALLVLWGNGLIEHGAKDLFGGTGKPALVANPLTRADIETLLAGFETGQTAGRAHLVEAVLARAQHLISEDPDGETPAVEGEYDPTMLIQLGPVRAALALSGGAVGTVAAGGSIIAADGTITAGLLAAGALVFQAITDTGGMVSALQWDVGHPKHPFPPHQALAGAVFTRFDDALLANVAAEWPGNPYWFPGDHLGCQCSIVSTIVLPEVLNV
jgi:hypothetical protein